MPPPCSPGSASPRPEGPGPASGTKRLRHPLLGEVTFHHVVLQVADDPDLKLVTFSAADGNQEPLARLAATITPP